MAENLATLRGEVKALQLTVSRLESEIKRAVKFFTFLNPSKLLIKKLPELSLSTYKRLAIEHNIQAGDILYIEDMSTYSKKAIELMQGSIKIIISAKVPSALKTEFIFLKPESLELIEWRDFAIIDKKELDSAVSEL